MKSIIIPITQDNKQSIANSLPKIALIANNLNTHSNLEHYLILTIQHAFKNNPIPLTAKTQQNLKADIIQIIQQHVDYQNNKYKEPSLSAINNAIWKLVKNGILIEVDGLYILHSAFKDIDQVEQIVFRFNNAIEDK